MSSDTKAIMGAIVSSSLERFDARLETIEVSLGRVDQRLLTIGRVVFPSSASGE